MIDRRPPPLVALVARPSQLVASDAEALCGLEATSTEKDRLSHNV
jgi:hypothetical protein